MPYRHALSLLLFSSVLLSGAPAYKVSVDTGSLAGTDGAIYLQFSPGLNSDNASISITEFAIGAPGSLSGLPSSVGDVTGSLSGLPLIIGNTNGLNDYLHGLTYGASMNFSVEFNVPGTLAGDSGSAFLFQLTGPDGISPVLSQDPSGFLGQISYDTNRMFSSDVYSPAAKISTGVPEPGYFRLVACGLVIAGAIRKIRRAATARGI